MTESQRFERAGMRQPMPHFFAARLDLEDE
jgi:hypothetical protein